MDLQKSLKPQHKNFSIKMQVISGKRIQSSSSLCPKDPTHGLAQSWYSINVGWMDGWMNGCIVDSSMNY